MRPIPVPNDLPLEPHQFRKIIASPDGSLTDDNIRPVEAIVEPVMMSNDSYVMRFSVLIQIEEADHQALAESGGHFWISFLGAISPFSLSVQL